VSLRAATNSGCGWRRWTVLAASCAALAAQEVPSFDLDVLPVLQRQGCSAAECHGGATGRGGFKLSLFASDPDADHFALAVDLDGRRLDTAHPERSLLLRKPSGGLPHGGGLRLPDSGDAYALLRQWIAAGAPRSAIDAARLVELELTGAVDGSGPVRAWAILEQHDGARSRRDVSHLARWESSAPSRVEALADGNLVRHAPGPASVVARFGHCTAALHIASPFAPRLEPAPAAHALDRGWLHTLGSLGLAPAPSVGEYQLLRRLSLDLTGRVPRPEEIRAFVLENASQPLAERIAVAAAALMRTDAHLDLWARRVARWLDVDPDDAAPAPQQARAGRLLAVVREFLAQDRPLVELAPLVLRDEPGFLAGSADPRDRAEFVAQSLLGVRLGCARCHDHPLDRWRQRDHLAFSAWLAEPRHTASGKLAPGLVFAPGSEQGVAPAPLPVPWGDAEALVPERRVAQLLSFVRSTDHDLLGRNLAHRTFAALMGRGLLSPPDDQRPGNAPRDAAMAEALMTAFRRDSRLSALLAWLVQSRFYAAATALEAASGAPGVEFSHRAARPLDRDVWPRAVAAALGVPPVQQRLPDEPLARMLAQWHGAYIEGALRGGATSVDALLDFGGSPRERLEQLFLLILSRPPRAEEVDKLIDVFEDGGRRHEVLDLAQALLLSREFHEYR